MGKADQKANFLPVCQAINFTKEHPPVRPLRPPAAIPRLASRRFMVISRFCRNITRANSVALICRHPYARSGISRSGICCHLLRLQQYNPRFSHHARLAMSHTTQTPPQSLFDRIGGRPKLQKMLHHFYADVRQHNLIGPIFNSHVKDWPHHMEVIGDFWSGITGGPARYRGGMPYKHFPLGLERDHFAAWLGLWERNCHQHLPPEAATDMIEIAHTIGGRLHLMIERQKG